MSVIAIVMVKGAVPFTLITGIIACCNIIIVMWPLLPQIVTMANVMIAKAVVVVVLMVLIQAVKHIILRIRLKVSAPLIANNANSFF